MTTAVRHYRGPEAEDREARLVLAAYGNSAQRRLRALAPQLPGYAAPKAGAGLAAQLASADLLCIVVGEEPEAVEQAAAQLRAARDTDGLSVAFAPAAVHQRLRPWADALGEWPRQRATTDLAAARRQRRTAADLAAWLSAVEQLLNQRGLICVDYADVRCVIHRAGRAAVAVGQGAGPERIPQALAGLRAALAAQGVDRRACERAVLAIRSPADYSVQDLDATLAGLAELLPHLTTTCAGARTHPAETLELSLLTTTAQPHPGSPHPHVSFL